MNFSSQKQTHSNQALIPDDIDFVMSVNTQELINTFLFDVFFKVDLDDKSAKLFRPKEKEPINQMGAELSSEVVLFYDNWNNTSAKGVLVNISNEGDFKRYQTDGSQTIKLSNSDHGVLIYLDDKASPETIAHYTKLAERILDKERKRDSSTQDRVLVNLTYKGDQLTYLNDLTLDLDLKNQTLTIDGKGKLNKPSKVSSSTYSILKNPISEKNLEIQTSEIPEDAMNYLGTFINGIGIDIPVISSQQMMIYGITLDNIGGSTAFLPKFDWILRFNDPVDIDSVVKNIHHNYKSLVDLNNKVIKVGSVKYHYSQISENEIYIGINESAQFAITEGHTSHLTRGFPSAVLEIEGKGFIANFILLLPQVKLSKQFLEDVTYFDIRALQVEDSLNIKGEIRMKEDQLMSVELAKYMMRFMK